MPARRRPGRRLLVYLLVSAAVLLAAMATVTGQRGIDVDQRELAARQQALAEAIDRVADRQRELDRLWRDGCSSQLAGTVTAVGPLWCSHGGWAGPYVGPAVSGTCPASGGSAGG